jgi:hypothetical protein
MAKRAKQSEADLSHHISRLRDKLAEAARYAKQDISKHDNPKAQALFETTAEVLDGLIRACDHAEQKSEPAWM